MNNYENKNGLGPKFESNQTCNTPNEESAPPVYGVPSYSSPAMAEVDIGTMKRNQQLLNDASQFTEGSILSDAHGDTYDTVDSLAGSAAKAETKPVSEPTVEDIANNPMFASVNTRKSSKNPKKSSSSSRKKVRKHSVGYTVFKVVIFVLFAAVLAFYGMSRMEEANKLIGSTQLPIQENEQSENNNTPDSTQNNIPDVIPSITPSSDIPANDTPDDYNYLETAELDDMSPMDLALWYMNEFEAGIPYNEKTLEEFEKWYSHKIEQDKTFDEDYKTAVDYLKNTIATDSVGDVPSETNASVVED